MPKQIVLSGNNNYTQDMMQRLNDGLFINDSIWRIGSDYAGCRDYNFKFNAEAFKVNAVRPNVKMIELKLSAFNNRANISARKISYSKQTNNWQQASSDVNHTAFSNAESMVIFLDSLRQLSDKKPVGISFYITDKKEFREMCYAFCKTLIIPDFIVVEGYGKENILLNMPANPGMPLFEALLFVSKTLEQFGLSKEIKIIAASEIYSAFDVLKLCALGANAVSMRNFPTSGDKLYQTAGIGSTRFSPQNMERFRNEILNNTIDIMQAWGYINIKDITLSSFFRNLDALNSKDVDTGYDGWDISERKTYQLSPEYLYGKNTSSGVFLN
ncbi:MAG: glutamate synthase-related protein [Ginsengibacter sp.]